MWDEAPSVDATTSHQLGVASCGQVVYCEMCGFASVFALFVTRWDPFGTGLVFASAYHEALLYCYVVNSLLSRCGLKWCTNITKGCTGKIESNQGGYEEKC